MNPEFPKSFAKLRDHAVVPPDAGPQNSAAGAAFLTASAMFR
jgi:hypothetical protein